MKEVRDIFGKHHDDFKKMMNRYKIQDIHICYSDESTSADNNFFKLPVHLIVHPKDECDNGVCEKFRLELTKRLRELKVDSSLFTIITVEELSMMKLGAARKISDSILENIKQGKTSKASSIKDKGSMEEAPHTPSNIKKP